ncbi:MAG: hypothetical protein CMF55_01805 [Legionellales bacterium]|nr:hypothetical protein [Legionellales bacterium]HAG62242.1 hypothetical protein [Coxiellaceae bacterium]
MMQKLDWLPQDLHNTQAINPLAGCAAPLLTIAYQLTEQTEPLDDTESLITTLLEECKHFYQKANKMGYHVQQILAAQYWLCATLDELIIDLPNPNKQQYPSLLKQLNHPSESLFFAILDEQEQASKPSGDTLEIAYLCLCLGYRNTHQNNQTSIIEKRQAKLLSQTQNIRQKPNNTQQKSPKKITPLIITVIVLATTASLLTIYTDLQHTLKPLNHALSEINQPNISTNP